MSRIVSLSLAFLFVSITAAQAQLAPQQRQPSADPGAYSPQLEARSRKIFPWMSQEAQRQQWMADQERRAIEIEISRTRPLLYR
jgi:hypothetical protein